MSSLSSSRDFLNLSNVDLVEEIDIPVFSDLLVESLCKNCSTYCKYTDLAVCSECGQEMCQECFNNDQSAICNDCERSFYKD